MRGPRLAACALALAALAAAAAPALPCELDAAPTTRWTIARADGVAWLEDPCGARMLGLGVDVVDAGASGDRIDRAHYDWRRFAPSRASWAATTRARLGQWGFNSAGAWSLAPQELRLPTTINLELGRLARFHWFDPFAPATALRIDALARQLTAPYAGTPYRIGYFSDNEVGWWGGALFRFYSAKRASNHTKARWVALMRTLYGGDWNRFTADFVPPAGVRSWDALLHRAEPTRLRVGGEGSRAVAAWTGVVAERYYALTAAAIKAADGQALFLGDRLPIYYDPAAVRAEAPYVDAIAVNYDVDSPEGWIAPYFFDGLRQLSGAKPVLVSEWFYAATENRSGNRNNGHLMTVATQSERAQGAGAAARNFAARPDVVGLDWFQYYDYPKGGRADHEDYDFGLVDIDDRPYERLVGALNAANRELPRIHAEASAPARARLAGFAVPEARIDLAQRSLVDWPKPASLLPPLRAAPGEVAFGEAYLAWSDDGLALATIGQDYYDPDLLAYDGAFPLREAYRLELDVDAGAGPRRFTLYIVPPRRAARELPMTVRLCAGAASEHAATSCPAVTGAQAVFLGASQPRVVAEALIPWAALGRDGPPVERRLRLELSASAWYRARWMSLSGLAPAEGSADPARWAEVALAPAGAAR
jgi:hypothetical protein